jgi:hypothetical protein
VRRSRSSAFQSLTPPSDEISPEQFAAELHLRIAIRCRGELQSLSLEEPSTIIQQRLQERE